MLENELWSISSPAILLAGAIFLLHMFYFLEAFIYPYLELVFRTKGVSFPSNSFVQIKGDQRKEVPKRVVDQQCLPANSFQMTTRAMAFLIGVSRDKNTFIWVVASLLPSLSVQITAMTKKIRVQ